MAKYGAGRCNIIISNIASLGMGLDRFRLDLIGRFNFAFKLGITTGQTSNEFPVLRQCRPLGAILQKLSRMKKPLIIIVTLAITACTAFYIWTAILAKQKSNDLMSKFKEVDSSLSSSDLSLVPNGGTGAIEEVYISSSMKSQVILLIDSLKEIYEIPLENSKQIQSTKERRLFTKRLLSYIQDYNQLKKSEVDSQIPDTIIYNSGLGKFNGQRWQSDYFEGVPKEVSITYLNFLRNQLLKNN